MEFYSSKQCSNLTHVTVALGIPPELVILGYETGGQTLSLTVEPGRPLNITCQSLGEHAGNVMWIKSGENFKTNCLYFKH